MAPSRRTTQILILCLPLLFGGTAFWLLGDQDVTAPALTAPRAAAAAPALADAALLDELPPPPPATQTVALELDESLLQLGDALFTRWEREAAQRRAAQTALQRAEALEIDAVGLRHELEALARQGGAVAVAELLLEEMADAPTELVFQTALGLSHFPEVGVCARLLRGLEDAPEHLQPALVFALRGSTARSVDNAFAELYSDATNTELLRNTAAFNLASPGRLERLPADTRAQLVEAARTDLLGDQRACFTAAADVLGSAALGPSELSWLRRLASDDLIPERRLAAMRVLARQGMSDSSLQAELQDLLANGLPGL